MKKFLMAVLMSLSLMSGAAVAQDRPLGNWVIDNAKVLNQDQLASAQQFSQSMERESGIRLGLVTFASTSQDPKQLAVDTINNWQMGPKSVLVLVSLNPRKVYIQPGNSLASSLNADVCTGICKNSMVPYLKSGDWAGGIMAGFRDIRSKASVSAPAPAAQPQPVAPRTVTKTVTTQTNTTSGNSGAASGMSALVFVGIVFGGIFALFVLVAFISWLFEPREKIVYQSGGYSGGYSGNPTPVGSPSPPIYQRPASYSAPAYSAPAYSAPYVAPAPVIVNPPVVYGGGYNNNNGFVEGMILGEILESNHNRHDSYRSDSYSPPVTNTTTTVTETISYSDPSPPSSSYDSGSSSSYDSGSSFDSSSSSGGFDCGGGGGGGSDF